MTREMSAGRARPPETGQAEKEAVAREAPPSGMRPVAERRAPEKDGIRLAEERALRRDLADFRRASDAKEKPQIQPFVESAVNWAWKGSSLKEKLIGMIPHDEFDPDSVRKAAMEAKRLVVEECRFDILKLALAGENDAETSRAEMEKAAVAAIDRVAVKLAREKAHAAGVAKKEGGPGAKPPTPAAPTTQPVWRKISGLFRR